MNTAQEKDRDGQDGGGKVAYIEVLYVGRWNFYSCVAIDARTGEVIALVGNPSDGKVPALTLICQIAQGRGYRIDTDKSREFAAGMLLAPGSQPPPAPRPKAGPLERAWRFMRARFARRHNVATVVLKNGSCSEQDLGVRPVEQME